MSTTQLNSLYIFLLPSTFSSAYLVSHISFLYFYFSQIYYLDQFYEPSSPENKYGTPRIKFFDKETIIDLPRVDKMRPRQPGEPFGHCGVSQWHFLAT